MMGEENTRRAERARRLLRSETTGVLATMSLEMPGFPFGSVTPFALSHEGRPMILVSDIAQHTRNMLADPRVSLIAAEGGTGNAQARGRATLLGEARPASPEEAPVLRARYEAFFPESRAYAQAHGFTIFVIEPRRVRFIGGFGDIFWVEAEDWLVETPAWAGGEARAIAHMNADHREPLVAMARAFLGRSEDEVSLAACDPEGCHLRVAGALARLDFPEPVGDREGLHRIFVALARRAREETGPAD